MRASELIVRLRNAEIRAANSNELALRASRIAEMDRIEVLRIKDLLGATNGQIKSS